MAGAPSDDYHHGDMPIADQKATWRGFMTVTQWGSVLTAMLLLQITLHFAAGLSWWPALAGSTILGLAAGLLLNMGSAWIATCVGWAVLCAIVGGLMALAGATV
jgi:hypothetical protein